MMITVYDLGGVTFDVSVRTLAMASSRYVPPAANFLGGDDFDQRIMDFSGSGI